MADAVFYSTHRAHSLDASVAERFDSDGDIAFDFNNEEFWLSPEDAKRLVAWLAEQIAKVTHGA